MNLPASQEGNWLWRYKEGVLTSDITQRLKELTDLYSRNNAFVTATPARH
jgi:4-alpha-glucanotransferase